jgi:rod shape-determining protein MreD
MTSLARAAATGSFRRSRGRMVHSAPFGTHPAVRSADVVGVAAHSLRPAGRPMARFSLALFIVACILLQGVVLPGAASLPILPNMVLVATLCWSALRGPGEGVIWAAVVGLVLDAVGLDPIGSNGLALVICALLGAAAGQRFFSANLFLPMPVAFVATFMYGLILLILRAGSGAGVPIGSLFVLLILQALLNSLMVLIVYPIARKIDARVVERR